MVLKVYVYVPIYFCMCVYEYAISLLLRFARLSYSYTCIYIVLHVYVLPYFRFTASFGAVCYGIMVPNTSACRNVDMGRASVMKKNII